MASEASASSYTASILVRTSYGIKNTTSMGFQTESCQPSFCLTFSAIRIRGFGRPTGFRTRLKSFASEANPYALDRSPGASSSGEAAIIAAGGSPLGLASDSGGSIRLPAHWCGVAGLKPTNGLVPITGHYPRIGPLSDPRTTIGPLARRVEDLGLALHAIAGPDSFDPAIIPMALGDECAIDVASLRIAWFTHLEGASPTSETVAAVETAA